MTRVWAEIDLFAIRHNIAAIQSLVGPAVDVMPVLKADAYGHGIREVAKSALAAGIRWLGVATVDEGVELREIAPEAHICVFSPFLADEAEGIVAGRLTPFVGDIETAQTLSDAAQQQRSQVAIHLKIDTGMGRSGALPDSCASLAQKITHLPALRITGLATHFPSAEDDPEFTCRQIDAFREVSSRIKAAGIQVEHLHCANSAAILRYPESHMSLVRPGLLVYGIRPDVPAGTPIPDVRPALSLKTRIALIRDLPEGHPISYGRTHILKKPSRVATLPVGYGDGYPRALSNTGNVLVAGRCAPIIGRVCMDVTLVDITGNPEAKTESEVVVIGLQGVESIRAEEIARLIDTTPHDVTTRLSARVPRVYLNR